MASGCCFKGTAQDGAPKGSIQELYTLKTYVTEGPNSSTSTPAIVIIPDAFGIDFVNSKLLADSFASAGYRVFLPDFMNGASCPIATLDYMTTATNPKSGYLAKAAGFAGAARGFVPFMYTNRPAITSPRIEKFLTLLRADVGPGVRIGAAGYCWGGLHAIRLAGGQGILESQKSLVNCVFVAHPSNLSLPVDAKNIKIPVSLAVGDKDFVLPPKQQGPMKEIMDKSGLDHEFKVYAGATHGFAVRGNPNVPEEKEYQQQARDQAIAWFDRFLK